MKLKANTPRIENHCIPIATTAPILRLFIRTFIDQRGGAKGYGYSGSGGGGLQSKSGHAFELANRSQNKSHIHRDDKGFVHMGDGDEISDTIRGGSVHGSENELVNHNGIMVKQEYEVRVEPNTGKRGLPIMKPY